MMLFARTTAVLIIAFLLGSIPTARTISVRIKGVDISTVGDGNTGARNVFHEIGPKFGVMVALIDFSKGALAVFLANAVGLNLGWQIIAGILAILGHDYSVFTNFKGGIGTATSVGTMLVLFPIPTILGSITYGIVFFITKNFNFSGNTGGAVGGLMLVVSHQWLLLGYAVMVYMLVHIKALIDSPHRMAMR